MACLNNAPACCSRRLLRKSVVDCCACCARPLLSNACPACSSLPCCAADQQVAPFAAYDDEESLPCSPAAPLDKRLGTVLWGTAQVRAWADAFDAFHLASAVVVLTRWTGAGGSALHFGCFAHECGGGL